VLFSPKVNEMIDEVANLDNLRRSWTRFFADGESNKVKGLPKKVEVLMFRRLRHAERNKNEELARMEKERIVLSNIGLLFFSKRKMGVWQGREKEDFIQDAFTIMDRCVRSFDHRRGFKFSTYAVRSILSEEHRLVNKKKTCQVDISKQFGLCAKETPDSITSETSMMRDIIDGNLAKLADIQLEIIRCRYYMNLTLKETAVRIKEINKTDKVLTKERIRQIEAYGLKMLEDYITSHKLLKKERRLASV
jgi:RNA polymerase sigma factor (sigma-70 family)